MNTPFYKNNSGFTLIELMVALAISAVLILLISSTYIFYINVSKKEENVIKIQQDLRSAFFILERDLYMAGYQPDPVDPAGVGIRVAKSNELEFSYVVDNDSNAFNIYNYSLVGENLIRKVTLQDGSTEAYIIAENIENIQFIYGFKDGKIDFEPKPPYNENDIVSVSFSILAKSEKPIDNYTSFRTFTPLSNGKTLPNGDIDNTVWKNNDPNDHYVRRIITTTIYCRNMGARN